MKKIFNVGFNISLATIYFFFGYISLTTIWYMLNHTKGYILITLAFMTSIAWSVILVLVGLAFFSIIFNLNK